jgi:hypothetical protein
MNAYTATCPAYKKVSYIPQWKTLTLVDDKHIKRSTQHGRLGV